MSRPLLAVLSALTLLLAVGAALADPGPWLVAAVSWLTLSIVLTAVYVGVVGVVKARRRRQYLAGYRRHPSSRGWAE